MVFPNPTLALVTLAALSGVAATGITLKPDPTTTQQSGLAGTDRQVIGNDGDFKALYEVSLAEDADIPCFISARGRHLNTHNTELFSYRAGGTSCDETDRSKITTTLTGADTYVHGIQVCLNNSRVKGVRLFGAAVNPVTGVITPNYTQESNRQVNCPFSGDAWKVERYCPTGKIATKLEVRYQSDSPTGSNKTKEAITGLALICRSVEVK